MKQREWERGWVELDYNSWRCWLDTPRTSSWWWWYSHYSLQEEIRLLYCSGFNSFPSCQLTSETTRSQCTCQAFICLFDCLQKVIFNVLAELNWPEIWAIVWYDGAQQIRTLELGGQTNFLTEWANMRKLRWSKWRLMTRLLNGVCFEWEKLRRLSL